MNPVFNKGMLEAAVDALQNERFILGESVYKFEEEFARYCGVKHAVSTSSGTAALYLSLVAIGIKQGDEVITTPASFIATANAIMHAGATPVFADINMETYNMDPGRAEEKIGKNSRAIIPVHLYGYPVDMDQINEMAERHGLFVVEDACQAHGAMYKCRKVGSLGNVGCFSFYPSKCMTVAGDGGMVITNDGELAEIITKLRNCGRTSWNVHDLIGYTARLNTVNAAVGRVQLRYLDKWNEMRRKKAGLYNRLLSDINELVLPPSWNSDFKPVYHLYVIRTEYRDKLKSWLEKNGVACGLYYKFPIHLQPVYRELYGYRGGEYPKSEELCRTCLSMPMHPQLREDEIRYICKKIHEFFNNKLYERAKSSASR